MYIEESKKTQRFFFLREGIKLKYKEGLRNLIYFAHWLDTIKYPIFLKYLSVMRNLVNKLVLFGI